jgi:hypothetical protein
MATTTNYSWTTPDDTSLVKDGAAAIRSLGTSVDTTTKALNPSTTLGDIEYRSSTANTNTRLGIGTSGQVLAVSGGVPAWTTPSSGSMTLLSTTALSGSSITFSSISQSYRDLRIEIKDPTFSTNNSAIRLRVNADTGTNYGMFLATSEVGIANSYSGFESLTSFDVTRSYDMQNTSVDASFRYNLYDYKDTTSIRLGDSIASFQKGYSTAGNRILTSGQLFYNNVGTTISSITIAMSAGTFSTGTAYLYGVN